MATVTAGGTLDMRGPGFFFTPADSDVTLTFTTLFELTTPDGRRQHYMGSFQYEVDPETGDKLLVDGTITKFVQSITGMVTVADINLSVLDWASFIFADDANGLHNFVFAGDDTIIGSAGPDYLLGFGGNDRLIGGESSGGILNDNFIDGGDGVDTAVFHGARSGFSITKSNGYIHVWDTRDLPPLKKELATLVNVEYLEFDDGTFIANTAPVVAASNLAPAHGTLTIASADFLKGIDADGDSLVYEVWDDTVGNGRFILNGVAQRERTTIRLPDYAFNLTFKTSDAGSDTLWVRAFDGVVWSRWVSFTVGPVPNAAPVVTVSDQTFAKGTASIAGTSLILGATDGDGDAITQYRFYDDKLGGGRFSLNGTPQAEKAGFVIAADQLANLSFVLGAPGTSDLLWVQAYDGYAWGEYKSFTVAANHVPVITIPNANVAPAHGMTTIAASTLFSANDADGDTITQYRFWDDTIGNGRFQLNGVDLAEDANITVNATDLAKFAYRTSATGGDLLWVQAFDGLSWGAWQSVNVAAVPNQTPVAAGIAHAPGKNATSIAASSMVNAMDADGDPIESYEFWDSGLHPNSGYFVLSGTKQATNAAIAVTATNLANLSFQLGAVSDQLWVRAYDGVSWSAWQSFTVAAPANAAPAVTIPNANVAPAHGTTSIAASTLFNVSDPDGDTIQKYEFWDSGLNPNSGRFVLNGDVRGVDVAISVSAADLTNLDFQLGTVSDQLWVRAYDGSAWSDWKSINVAPPQNIAPTVNVQTLNPAHADAFIAGADLFTANDPDGDTITKYRFFDDTAGNGRFQLNGADQVELANIEIDASALANFRYRTSSTGDDTLWVQAYDGRAWGAWKSFTAKARPNATPTIVIDDVHPAHGVTHVWAFGGSWITDLDGDTVTKYRFFDGTAGNGRFQLNGIDQAELRNIEISASDMMNFRFRLGTTGGSDTLWAQAYDGIGWGAWTMYTATPAPNQVPVVEVQTVTPAHKATFIAGANLFAASDADFDDITRIRFYDGTVGNGRFQLNGFDQAEMANIEIDAAELANFRYRASTTGAGDTLWVQVSDGYSWSTWKSFTATVPWNAAPVVNVQDIHPGRTDAFIAGSTLFVNTFDFDADPITKYRFYDGTSGNGRFQRGSVDQAELSNIEISASDLANFRYRTSTTGSGDVLWMQVYDGIDWSTWKSFNVSGWQNRAPVIAIPTANVIPPHDLDVFAAGALFSVSDADGDSITQYRFFDGTSGNGRFELNGAAKGELTNITVNASDLNNFRFRSSTTDTGDVLWVQAFDGTAWSEWKAVTVAPVPNEMPIVQARNFTPAHGVTSMFASTLFTVTDTDEDFPLTYRFLDATAGNGYFTLNGVQQAAGTEFEINYSDLPNLRYVTSSTGSGDTMSVQVYDGHDWSDRKTFTVAAPQSDGPIIYVENLVYDVTPNYLPASALFVAADPGSIQRYRFLDTGGLFRLNDVSQQAQHVIEIDAADLPNLIYMAGGGKETVSVQAFDGVAWTDWQSFEARSITYGSHGSWYVLVDSPMWGAPDATPANAVVQAGSSISLDHVLSATDPQGDPITEWQIRDGTFGRGVLTVNGVPQPEFQDIDAMANQLASVAFQAGNTAGFNRLWARASDSQGAWSEWKPFVINTLAPV